MKRVLLFFCMLFSLTSVNASENVLQTIEIEPVKDTYNIVLISDKAVDVKKDVQASNQITLNMKNIRASKTLNTVYNNVSNVDTVMVEPKGNGLSIFFQAENAQGATVSFDSMAVSDAAKTATKKSFKNIKLNSPIESYAPIYQEEFNKEKTPSIFDKFKPKKEVSEFDENLGEENNSDDLLNKIFSLGLVGLLGFAVIRLFKRKEPAMKIGLSQSLNDREIDMYGGNSPLGPMYQPERPYTSVNYGLNAYQKEARNPYETSPMQIHNPRLRAYAQQPQTMEQAPVQQNYAQVQPQSTMTATQPKMTRPVTSDVTLNKPNIDNLKFLESMTAIYEKSGRHDLAKGLRASLSKNNIQA